LRAAELMNRRVLTVRPEDSMREAAEAMDQRGVAGAIVAGEDGGSPGILTARDVVAMIGGAAGTQVEDHYTRDAVIGEPGWSLERAAEVMVEGRFRHLIVTEAGRIEGVLSIRDIVGQWLAERAEHRVTIQIREAMHPDFLEVTPETNLCEVAEAMIDRDVGAALIPSTGRFSAPGIASERDLLRAAGRSASFDRVAVGDELRSRTTYSAPDWSLRQAAEAMIKGDFQHVVVVDTDGVVGIIAMRDILARWLR